MSASEALPAGIYEALLSEELRGLLDTHPELRPVFGKIDDESSAARINWTDSPLRRRPSSKALFSRARSSRPMNHSVR